MESLAGMDEDLGNYLPQKHMMGTLVRPSG
jgi:hypothetical protein